MTNKAELKSRGGAGFGDEAVTVEKNISSVQL
jgi:hypothetical protein